MYRQVEVQGNSDVHVVDYDDDTYTTPRRWDMYDRLASSIEWLGFGDSGGEGGTPNEILFSASLKFLPLPMVAGTWNDNATVTVPGEGTYTATFSGRVIAREDLDLPVGKSAVDKVGRSRAAPHLLQGRLEGGALHGGAPGRCLVRHHVRHHLVLPDAGAGARDHARGQRRPWRRAGQLVPDRGLVDAGDQQREVTHL